MVPAVVRRERRVLHRSADSVNSTNVAANRPTGRSLLTMTYGILIGVAIVAGLVILGLLTD